MADDASARAAWSNGEMPMKIVHVGSTDAQGGAGLAALRLHEALSAHGADSRMLVVDKRTATPGVEAIRWPAAGSRIPRTAAASVRRMYVDANRALGSTHFSTTLEGIELSGHPAIRRADVIHLHWVASFQTAATVAALVATGTPVVWTLHDINPFTGGCHFPAGCEGFRSDCADCRQLGTDAFGLPAATLRDKRDLWSAAAIRPLAPSRWMAEQARRSAVFGQAADVPTAANAIDTGAFRAADQMQARAALGLPANGTFLLCGADQALERRKGFDLLARALSDPGRDPLLTADRGLLWVGGDPPPTLAGVDHVISLGKLDPAAMADAYAAADVFVLPSREDHMPNMMLEAMACRRPVVACDVGAIGEVIEDGVNGRIVPIDDAPALAGAIRDLLESPDLRRAMGARARALVEARHAYPVSAERHLAIYAEALASAPSLDPLAAGLSRPRGSAGPAVDAVLPGLALDCLTRELAEVQERLTGVEADREAQQREIEMQHETLERRNRVIAELQEGLRVSEADRAAQREEVNMQHEVLRDRLRVIEELAAHRDHLEGHVARELADRDRALAERDHRLDELQRPSHWRRGFTRAAGVARTANWWDAKIPPLLAVVYLESLRLGLATGRSMLLLGGYCLAIGCVAAYGHVVNDVFDMDSDARAGKSNAAAGLSGRTRALLGATLLTAGFLPLVLLGAPPVTLGLLALNYLWPTVYSLPVIRLKERGVLGLMADAAGSHVTPTLVALSLLESEATGAQPHSGTLFFVAIVLAAAASGLKGILHHQIIDRDGDRSAGTVTFATGVPAERLQRLLPPLQPARRTAGRRVARDLGVRVLPAGRGCLRGLRRDRDRQVRPRVPVRADLRRADGTTQHPVRQRALLRLLAPACGAGLTCERRPRVVRCRPPPRARLPNESAGGVA